MGLEIAVLAAAVASPWLLILAGRAAASTPLRWRVWTHHTDWWMPDSREVCRDVVKRELNRRGGRPLPLGYSFVRTAPDDFDHEGVYPIFREPEDTDESRRVTRIVAPDGSLVLTDLGRPRAGGYDGPAKTRRAGGETPPNAPPGFDSAADFKAFYELPAEETRREAGRRAILNERRCVSVCATKLRAALTGVESVGRETYAGPDLDHNGSLAAGTPLSITIQQTVSLAWAYDKLTFNVWHRCVSRYGTVWSSVVALTLGLLTVARGC